MVPFGGKPTQPGGRFLLNYRCSDSPGNIQHVSTVSRLILCKGLWVCLHTAHKPFITFNVSCNCVCSSLKKLIAQQGSWSSVRIVWSPSHKCWWALVCVWTAQSACVWGSYRDKAFFFLSFKLQLPSAANYDIFSLPLFCFMLCRLGNM